MEDDKIELITDTLTEADIIENIKTWDPGNYRGDIVADNPPNREIER